MKTSYKDALAALMTALNTLNQAYKAANTAGDKDQIFSVMEILQDEVNAIAIAGLAFQDAAYVAQTAVFQRSAAQLKAFQEKVDTYIHYIKMTGEVADALAKVMRLLA